MKHFLFCLAFLFQLFSSSQLWSQNFFITELQMMTLEMNSKMQSELLNKQMQELTTLKNQLNESKNQSMNLQTQLNESQEQLMTLNQQLKQTSESLRKSKSKELLIKTLIGSVCFSAGVGIGVILAR